MFTLKYNLMLADIADVPQFPITHCANRFSFVCQNFNTKLMLKKETIKIYWIDYPLSLLFV